MFLVVGLGNPGEEYSLSRHNVGFKVVDELARRLDVNVRKKGFKGFYSESHIDRKKLIFLKPQTYMNKSGEAVSEAVRYFNIASRDIIVVQDELDLPTGTLQIKEGGGSAGHKGVDSIVSCLGEAGFIRVRIGIGKPTHKPEVINHVLSEFELDEMENIKEVINKAVEAVLEIFQTGIESAMNKFNKRAKCSRSTDKLIS
ncbi:aminoacyl-tRNA hydrolase [Desulfobacterota bacterium AH_259_B03_O07]|nr:aminoacyl-tRNA hydrolase [Desulfobacterota bacterium AH_259_B03_O07]